MTKSKPKQMFVTMTKYEKVVKERDEARAYAEEMHALLKDALDVLDAYEDQAHRPPFATSSQARDMHQAFNKRYPYVEEEA